MLTMRPIVVAAFAMLAISPSAAFSGDSCSKELPIELLRVTQGAHTACSNVEQFMSALAVVGQSTMWIGRIAASQRPFVLVVDQRIDAETCRSAFAEWGVRINWVDGTAVLLDANLVIQQPKSIEAAAAASAIVGNDLDRLYVCRGFDRSMMDSATLAVSRKIEATSDPDELKQLSTTYRAVVAPSMLRAQMDRAQFVQAMGSPSQMRKLLPSPIVGDIATRWLKWRGLLPSSGAEEGFLRLSRALEIAQREKEAIQIYATELRSNGHSSDERYAKLLERRASWPVEALCVVLFQGGIEELLVEWGRTNNIAAFERFVESLELWMVPRLVGGFPAYNSTLASLFASIVVEKKLTPLVRLVEADRHLVAKILEQVFEVHPQSADLLCRDVVQRFQVLQAIPQLTKMARSGSHQAVRTLAAFSELDLARYWLPHSWMMSLFDTPGRAFACLDEICRLENSLAAPYYQELRELAASTHITSRFHRRIFELLETFVPPEHIEGVNDVASRGEGVNDVESGDSAQWHSLRLVATIGLEYFRFEDAAFDRLVSTGIGATIRLGGHWREEWGGLQFENGVAYSGSLQESSSRQTDRLSVLTWTSSFSTLVHLVGRQEEPLRLWVRPAIGLTAWYLNRTSVLVNGAPAADQSVDRWFGVAAACLGLSVDLGGVMDLSAELSASMFVERVAKPGLEASVDAAIAIGCKWTFHAVFEAWYLEFPIEDVGTMRKSGVAIIVGLSFQTR